MAALIEWIFCNSTFVLLFVEIYYVKGDRDLRASIAEIQTWAAETCWNKSAAEKLTPFLPRDIGTTHTKLGIMKC